MIRFDRVTKLYPGNSHAALNAVDIEIKGGEFVFLVGPSGSGKSSFLRLVLREDRPSAGEVHVLGQKLNSIGNRKVPYFRRSLGVVFQDFRLLPNRTVYQNVAFTLQVIGKSKGFIQEAVPDVLNMVGLAGKSNRMPHELSGGEQQRVAIARAVVNKPAILLADEPTGNLDPVTSAGIMQVLELINASGTTVVMATHDVSIVDSMQRRVIELVGGNVIRDERQGSYQTTSVAVQPDAEPAAPAEPALVSDPNPARAGVAMPAAQRMPAPAPTRVPLSAPTAVATPVPVAMPVPVPVSAAEPVSTPVPVPVSAPAPMSTSASVPLPAPAPAPLAQPLTEPEPRRDPPVLAPTRIPVPAKAPLGAPPVLFVEPHARDTGGYPLAPAAPRHLTPPRRSELNAASVGGTPPPSEPPTAEPPARGIRQVIGSWNPPRNGESEAIAAELEQAEQDSRPDPLRHILPMTRPITLPPLQPTVQQLPDSLDLAARLGLRSHDAQPEPTSAQKVGPTS